MAGKKHERYFTNEHKKTVLLSCRFFPSLATVGVVSNSIKGNGTNRGQPPGDACPQWQGQTRTPEGRANPNPRGQGKPAPGDEGKTCTGDEGKTCTGDDGENPAAEGRRPPGVGPGHRFFIGLSQGISGQEKGEGTFPLRVWLFGLTDMNTTLDIIRCGSSVLQT